MVAANGLLRIFWPSDAPRIKKQGTIVGWRNSELDIFVISILEDVEVERNMALNLFAPAENFGIGKICRACTTVRFIFSKQPSSYGAIAPTVWELCHSRTRHCQLCGY